MFSVQNVTRVLHSLLRSAQDNTPAVSCPTLETRQSHRRTRQVRIRCIMVRGSCSQERPSERQQDESNSGTAGSMLASVLRASIVPLNSNTAVATGAGRILRLPRSGSMAMTGRERSAWVKLLGRARAAAVTAARAWPLESSAAPDGGTFVCYAALTHTNTRHCLASNGLPGVCVCTVPLVTVFPTRTLVRRCIHLQPFHPEYSLVPTTGRLRERDQGAWEVL